MSDLQIFPYVNLDGKWSISDSVMAAIWLQLEQEGKIEHLFYDGSIKNVADWLAYLKRPGMFPAVMADLGKYIPVHIAWLKDINDGIAWAHHTAIGRYKRGVWEKYLDYWKKFNLRLLFGLTPESNATAIKFLKKICKFQIVGIIPEICNMVYEDKRIGGVVSYYQFQRGEQWIQSQRPLLVHRQSVA